MDRVQNHGRGTAVGSRDGDGETEVVDIEIGINRWGY